VKAARLQSKIAGGTEMDRVALSASVALDVADQEAGAGAEVAAVVSVAAILANATT
jgi:hypothetical protein